MELLYVNCIRLKGQFIYCFWIMCTLNVNVLITICMLFWESQWHLGKKKMPLFYRKMCCVHNVHFTSFLFLWFLKAWKAWILILMFGIQYLKHKMSRNQSTACWTYVWGSSGMHLVWTNWYCIWTMERIRPLTCVYFVSTVHSLKNDLQVLLQIQLNSLSSIETGILIK